MLLLDEPFNGLDPEGVRLVRRLLENLATQRECAVLVSSHVLDQLERLVDRYGILREGDVYKRQVMYLTGVSNIRDVIPHPRTVGNAEF